MHPEYRLGIDLGTNSLGWCALKLDRTGRPIGILELGVRLFGDGRVPQKGTSLAANRRVARQQRRRRDRYLRRRKELGDAFIRFGLMPSDRSARKDLETDDAYEPYALRLKGLTEALTPFQLGRALFHLHQRRGFRSTRATNTADAEEEHGKIEAGIERLRTVLGGAGSPTLGAWLAARHIRAEPVRARLVGKGAAAAYEFYPQRSLVEQEFESLWTTQSAHHPTLLTDEAYREIKKIIFRQRALQPVEPGRCTLDPNDERAPWALPLAQQFRIYQELNNLELIPRDGGRRRLTRAERDLVYERLSTVKELPFDRIRKLLGLHSDTRFNLEERRSKLRGDGTGAALAHKNIFGRTWWKIDSEQRNEIVETILSVHDTDALEALARDRWGLDEAAAHKVARVRLPHGYSLLGRKAMRRMKPIMRDQGLDYYHAAKEAGYEPSDFRGEGKADELPPYPVALSRHLVGGDGIESDAPSNDRALLEKRYGRFPNPTVHIGLNQLSNLVNTLIRRHGKPHEIVIELARDLKLNREDKRRLDERQGRETERNEKLREELASLAQKDNARNRKILKLWEELGPIHERRCIYTDRQISKAMLFGSELAIDHILPFKDTLDDSLSNQLLCLRSANDAKGKRTPFDAFGTSPEWPAIYLRAQRLPYEKRWRFESNALERFAEDRDFIARQLTDTAYLARVAKEYLGQVCPSDRVRAIPGKLTALLRAKWGLNGILSDSNLKNRADHRHHAIDAFVAGCTDPGLLKRMSDAAAAARLDRALEGLPEPWDGFDRDVFREQVRAITVSLKPDHGRHGRLHEETAYGIVKARPGVKEDGNVVYRRPFLDLSEKEITRIRDLRLRKLVHEHIGAERLSGRTLREALASFRDQADRPLRHVRVLKTEDYCIPLHDGNGHAYKVLVPGENWCIDIFEQPDGRWIGAAVTVFAANQPDILDERRKGHPTARRVMRVHKGDFLKLLDDDGMERIMRVYRLRAKKQQFMLAPHNEAGNLDDRHRDESDSFNWRYVAISRLKARRARRVGVDILGRVRDPGPPA